MALLLGLVVVFSRGGRRGGREGLLGLPGPIEVMSVEAALESEVAGIAREGSVGGLGFNAGAGEGWLDFVVVDVDVGEGLLIGSVSERCTIRVGGAGKPLVLSPVVFTRNGPGGGRSSLSLSS